MPENEDCIDKSVAGTSIVPLAPFRISAAAGSFREGMFFVRLCTFATALAVAVIPWLLGAQQTLAAGTKFKLVDLTLSLPAQPAEPKLTLLVEGSDPKDAQTELTDWKEVGGADPVGRYHPESSDGSPLTRYWPITVTFPTGRPKAGLRYVTFRYDGQLYGLSYVLSEAKAPSIDWSITLLRPEANLIGDTSIKIWIAAKDTTATDIHLLRQSIASAGDQVGVDGDWMFCQGQNCKHLGDTKTGFGLDVNHSGDFRIEPPAKADLVGKYSGSVWVASAELPSGQATPIVFYATAWWRPWIGIFILVVSVILSWLLGTYLHNRANLAQMERPFAVLRANVKSLANQRRTLRAPVKDASTIFATQLSAEQRHMTTSELRRSGALPPAYPSAFPPTANQAETYKNTLQTHADKIALLETVMDEGLLRVSAAHASAQDTSVTQEIDALSSEPKVDPATTIQTISDALQKLHPNLQAEFAQAIAPQIRGRTVETIDITLLEINVITWVLLGFWTIGVGWYVLIFNHPGFGTLADWFACAAWGFGLPVGAQQLGQATLSSVTKGLQIGV